MSAIFYGSLYLSVIARSEATKQSRNVRFRKGFGLLRFARNDNMMVFRGCLMLIAVLDNLSQI